MLCLFVSCEIMSAFIFAVTLLLSLGCLCVSNHVASISSTGFHPSSTHGLLEPYDGQPMSVELTTAQEDKLNRGNAVIFRTQVGSTSRGVIVLDVKATGPVCMEQILDFPKYSRMVSNIKNVDVYDHTQLQNGTTKTAAKFSVGSMGISFDYCILLTHEPKYDTVTWTLDYTRRSSYVEDNVGHWQVMPHPTKRGWTRLLYSTQLKLFGWIPEIFMNVLNNGALMEATSWVKREAELEASRLAALREESSNYEVLAH